MRDGAATMKRVTLELGGKSEEIKQRIVAVMANMPVGDPNNNDTAVGPMVTRTHYERVESYIRKGIEEGAEILVGGEGHPEGLKAGNFVKPTIFVNVRTI